MGFKKLTEYLDSLYENRNIPGVGLKIYHRHKPVYEHYNGYSDAANKRPFCEKTLVNLYSATKVITCAAALRLVEEGRMKLSDPLWEYIPEYKNLSVKHTDKDGSCEIRPAQNTITVENLFSMTAGIDWDRCGEESMRLLEENGGKAPTLKTAKTAASRPLNFEPGTKFQYGFCHDILGGLIEAVSGKRLGVYLKQSIFDPVGMTETFFEAPADRQDDRAVHYIGWNSKTNRSRAVGELYGVHEYEDYESGGGGLISSVPDYALFAQALCNYGLAQNGERILQAETVENMRRNRLGRSQMNDFASFGGASKAGYGYGLGVRTLVDRDKAKSLSSIGEFGWDGACGCYTVIDPDSQVAIFYAQEAAEAPWWDWHCSIRNFAYASVWE
ncbi:MAG: beta-lactamase family protein [Oscillospiraceae bacterium]|nr:beta-lactamase family protein [Oscillospiraceae bacterium]